MLQRPKVGETEEDLLKQEEEFLKQSGKEPTQKRNLDGNNDEKKSPAVPGIVGEVVERSQGLPCTPIEGNEAPESGFPALFQIDPQLKTDKKEKKSLFALHLEKNKNVSDNTGTETDAGNLSTGEAGPSPGSSTNQVDTANASGGTENDALSEDKKSVHEENLDKLSEMPEPEILEAQRKLYETLDPKLISLLKNRSKPKENDDANQESQAQENDDANQESQAQENDDANQESQAQENDEANQESQAQENDEANQESQAQENDDANQESQPQEVEEAGCKNSPTDEEVKETLASYVGEQWINMDFIEKEKLEWVGDIPSADALQPGQSFSARFDFNGELQPFRTLIDVTNSLYHHGDEPYRPGYTIQELYQLSRSSVRQQRILALDTLAKIIYKSTLGYYDTCFDGCLLQKLMDADLFLLLRFSLDEKSLIPSAINCLRRLLYNDSDEYCLDRLLGVTEEDMQPLLFDPIELDDVEEQELRDDIIIHSDVIKGVVRTGLLPRITYILNYHRCERETIINAILCFIRVARHSTESCERMMCIPNLFQFVYSTMNCDEPIYEGFKLFRILSTQSKDVAVEIATRYSLDFSITYLNLESVKGLSTRELYLLKLECIYLWKNLIRCGFMKDDFVSWTPCFVKWLRIFFERVDIYADSDFDFELFSALISLLRFCVCDKLPIDKHYVSMMYVCLEKWLNQLLQSEKFTYSSMKALGSSFAFFIDYFDIFGSDRTSLPFIRKVNGMITTLIRSPIFERMATNLTEYSHLLIANPINRDPSNLPSLSSVYEYGEDFLKIVNRESTLPFFASFAKYLQFNYEVLKQSKENIELFVNNSAIRNYVNEVMMLDINSGNWFERFEITLLTDILQLFVIANDHQSLELGFRLLPMIRVDEEDFVITLTVLTDKKTWNSNEEFFTFLPDIFLQALFKPEVRSGYALRYKNEAVGEDWAFKSLTNLRGRDTVIDVLKVLRYLSLITWRQPNLFDRVPITLRYYHLCSVFLTDANVFSEDIQEEVRSIFRCVLYYRERVDLRIKVDRKKLFYDYYTELITQYAAVSYGMHIFAELILFPLQNRFDVNLRKLMWLEYINVLKVITIPYPSSQFISIEEFIEPYETDESLLVAYLNSISSKVISKQKNPFVYNLAVANINNYMRNANPDTELYKFLSRRIRFTISERIKKDLTSW